MKGFELAVRLARRGIAVTQPSADIRKLLQPSLTTNADSLIATSQAIAVCFQTIAAANNYFRKGRS